MEPKLAENTSEYIKRTDLDNLMGKIVSSLQPRIQEAVEQAVQKAIEQTAIKTDEKIATVKGEIRGEFEAKLNQHIEQERVNRQQDIESVRQQIKDVGDETRQKLNEFNTSVDGAKKTVDEVNRTVELLSTTINGWNNSLSANRQLYEDSRRDLERLDTDSDELARGQEVLKQQTQALHQTIHGNGVDGPESLFSRQDTLEKLLKEKFVELQFQLTPTLELARSTSIRMDAFEQDRVREKERLAKWRDNTWGFLKDFLKSRQGMVLLVTALLSIVAIFRPDALAALGQLIQSLLISLSANP